MSEAAHPRALLAAVGVLLVAAIPALAQEPPAAGGGEQEKKPPDQLFPGIDIDLENRRITLEGTIEIPRGLIELVACTPWGKTHESICSLDVDPRQFKAALLLLGLEDKPQVEVFGERKALEGDRVIIHIEWEKDGKKERHRAEKLILDRTLGGPMEEVGWVFTGSRFLKVPVYLPDKEEPEERELFMAAEKGTLVTTYHDPDSILDNPLEKGGDDTIYYANHELLPPRGTPVRFIMEAAPKKGSKEPAPEKDPGPDETKGDSPDESDLPGEKKESGQKKGG